MFVLHVMGARDMCTCLVDNKFAMHFPDYKPGRGQFDEFFDRLIYINHRGDYDYAFMEKRKKRGKKLDINVTDITVTVAAVIISKDLILTSFNPFRELTKHSFKRWHTCVCNMIKRSYPKNKDASYEWERREVDCARQVVPANDDSIPDHSWFGNRGKLKKMHTPIHDLMVIRVKTPFTDIMFDNDYTRLDFLTTYKTKLKAGPIQTEVASSTDFLGDEFKFASLGHILDPDIVKNRDVFVGKVNADEKVLVDCEEWLPRTWGWFICLNNSYGIPQIGSGAMLYAHGKLFGVGSFTLNKGTDSLLVFTDVRKYHHLLNTTCTKMDQELFKNVTILLG